MMTAGLEADLIARRAAIATQARLCPHCGQPLIASVPAGAVNMPTKADEQPAQVDEPSGWRDRPSLI